MTAVAFAPPEAAISDGSVAFDELRRGLFASLARSDQRRTGTEYLRGLLQSRGRTSMRDLAAQPGVSANEQSLHHFIANSSWDWTPVRRALAAHLLPRLRPRAWVVHPFPAPRRTAQAAAFGVWAAAPELSLPVSWRLPAVPEGLSLGQALAGAALEPVRDWGLPALPAVLDARCADPAWLIGTLRAHGLPALLRIDDDLAVRDARSGPSARPATARAMADRGGNQRRPVRWLPEGANGPAHASLVWAGRIRLPGADPRAELTLLSTGECRSGRPARLWLSDLTGAPLDVLLRLTALLDRVGRESDRMGERFGLRDFAGRSAEAWHRHATLASAAYAVGELERPSPRPARSHHSSRMLT